MPDGGVDFGRDGSARCLGAFPGRDLRCAEEWGSGCLSRARVICSRKTVIPRIFIVEYWTIIVYYDQAFKSANSQEMFSTGVNGIDL